MIILKSHNSCFINGKKNSLNIVVDKYLDDDFESILINKSDCILFNG